MTIRNMKEEDREAVFLMMKDFYASDAVIEKASDDVLHRDITDAIGACPYLKGYIFLSDGQIVGYGMVATGYSTEFGGVCLWIEDLYIKPAYRHQGYGRAFLAFVSAQDVARVKLEVELANERAMDVYRRSGFHVSDYVLMTKEKTGES